MLWTSEMVHWPWLQWNVFQYFVRMVQFRSPANGYYPNDSETLNLVLFSLDFATLVRSGVDLNLSFKFCDLLIILYLFSCPSLIWQPVGSDCISSWLLLIFLLYLISSQSLKLGGRRGTTDDVATILFHPSMSFAALRESPNPILVYSLMLSCRLFFCLPLLLAPFTVPWRIVFAMPEDLEMWPYHLSFRFFTMVHNQNQNSLYIIAYIGEDVLLDQNMFAGQNRSGYSPGGRASKNYLPGRQGNNLLLYLTWISHVKPP